MFWKMTKNKPLIYISEIIAIGFGVMSFVYRWPVLVSSLLVTLIVILGCMVIYAHKGYTVDELIEMLTFASRFNRKLANATSEVISQLYEYKKKKQVINQFKKGDKDIKTLIKIEKMAENILRNRALSLYKRLLIASAKRDVSDEFDYIYEIQDENSNLLLQIDEITTLIISDDDEINEEAMNLDYWLESFKELSTAEVRMGV